MKISTSIIVLFILLSTTVRSQQLGMFAVSATFTISGYDRDKASLDSVQWISQKIITPTYEGKKIKRILLQLSTNKVVLFLGGSDLVEMDKSEAIAKGYITIAVTKPVKEKVKSTAPSITVINVDSPLYVGITNHIPLVKLPGKKNNHYYIPEWQPIFQIDSANNEMQAEFTNPGMISLFIYDSKIDRCVYQYNYTIKRLPQDELKNEPILTIGNLKGLNVDASLFRQQTSINISNGFTFKGATIYFSGQPFSNVYSATINTISLDPAKIFLDECLPGSNITFNNVQVSDSTGKEFVIHGCTYQIIDAAAISMGASPDSNTNNVIYPSVIEGSDSLFNYLQKRLAKYKYDDINIGYTSVFVEFKVMADGAIKDIPVDPFIPKNSLERKCLDLIENGPKWKPAQYKGRNIDLLFSYHIDFDVEN